MRTVPRGQLTIGQQEQRDPGEKPVYVDMFCGAGGESQGVAQAAEKAGIAIEAYAINHWERAIETHQANFPEAEHICRNVQDITPSDLVPGRRVALLWASPACTHFSVARGGKPCDDQSRVTPFTVLSSSSISGSRLGSGYRSSDYQVNRIRGISIRVSPAR